MLKTVSSISNVIGALNYKGTWNANSNVPVLSSGVGTKGDYYVVSTAGSTNLDGTTLWGVGDWAVFNGSIWQKVDGGDTSAVTSLTVTGLTGYMYANNTSPVTASTTIPVSNVAGAVPNTVYVIAGTGLSGGGALTGNVTFNISNTTVTLGSYGSANTVPTYTVNALGQLTAASNTSIAIDAGAITTGTLAVARGGTNIASYTIGDLIYASGTTTLAKLPDVAVGSVVVSGGVGAAPAYSATPNVTSLTATTSLTSPIHNSSTTLSLQTGGTAGLYIDASQNVGIGTSSPTSRLHVYTSSSEINRLTSTAVNGGYQVFYADNATPAYLGSLKAILVSGNASDFAIVGTGANNMVFGTNSAERMRIDSSGNVGIGTTSPTAALSVNGNINYQPQSATTQTNYFSLGATGSLGNATGSKLTFRRNYDNVELVTIDGFGNVGIGATANASAILDAQSTTKGVRFPNMTTTQKNAISSPAAGLVVFDTTLAKLCVYSGSAWQTVTSI